jgi:hypothetical protein
MSGFPPEKTWIEFRIWKLGILWLVVVAVVMARLPLFWSSGEFVAEDAWVFFAEAFNSSWTSSLLTPYAGYFHLLPRILAELLSILPLTIQTYAYAMVGISLNALFFSLFYLPQFRHLIGSDGARATVVLILALAQNSENMGFLLGLHWYIAFLLPLLVVMKFPQNRSGRWVMYTTSVACIWSSPSNLVLGPILLWQLLVNKTENAERKWRLFTLANLIVVAGFIVLLRLRDSARTGEFSLSHIPYAIDRLMLRGWLGTGFLGQTVSEALVSLQPWLLDVSGLLFFCVLAKLVYDQRKSAAGQCVVILLVSAILMIGLSMTRSLYIAELSDINLPRHVRYLTGPTLLLNIGALILLYHFFKNRSQSVFYIVCAIQALLLVVGLPKVNHWSREHETFRIRDFVSEIKTFQSKYLKTGKPGVLYVPSDVPYWGPVLRSGNEPPETNEPNLRTDASISTIAREDFPQRMVPFKQNSGSNIVEHPKLGKLSYDGLAEGRLWFRNSSNKLMFTSELLYPYLWTMDGQKFELIKLE